MDKGPWWATVHVFARVGHDFATKHIFKHPYIPEDNPI